VLVNVVGPLPSMNMPGVGTVLGDDPGVHGGNFTSVRVGSQGVS
jgi:hypothetical protein